MRNMLVMSGLGVLVQRVWLAAVLIRLYCVTYAKSFNPYWLNRNKLVCASLSGDLRV